MRISAFMGHIGAPLFKKEGGREKKQPRLYLLFGSASKRQVQERGFAPPPLFAEPP